MSVMSELRFFSIWIATGAIGAMADLVFFQGRGFIYFAAFWFIPVVLTIYRSYRRIHIGNSLTFPSDDLSVPNNAQSFKVMSTQGNERTVKAWWVEGYGPAFHIDLLLPAETVNLGEVAEAIRRKHSPPQ